jgi:lipopolysaccharide export system protein LptA
MKIFSLLLLIALGVQAQTNAPVENPAPRAATVIDSEGADFDLNSTNRVAIYYGHVFLNNPEVKLWCERLTVNLPADSEGGHLSHAVAETNVVIDFMDSKGQTNHLTAAKAVYAYSVANLVTNESVIFTGSPDKLPVVTMPDATIVADQIVWDRASGHYHFVNPHMSGGGGTNASPMKLL